MNEAKPKRRWFTFGLRTLLLLITALCVWLGIQVNAARRQREAVVAIQKAGGMVIYDYQVVPPVVGQNEQTFPWDPRKAPPAPAWLRDQIGDDYFRTAEVVDFSRPKRSIAKADLDQLAKLPGLKRFTFEASSGGPIEDKDLAALSELNQLEVLWVFRAHVDGSFLASLPNPKRLKQLCLEGTYADDAAMEHIATMKMLKWLVLSNTHVTDAGLVHLRNLTNLESLELGGTRITDAGVQHLTGLKKLAHVSLLGSKVTAAGVSTLKAALPNADIQGLPTRPPWTTLFR